MVNEETQELSLERLFELEAQMISEIEAKAERMREALDGNIE